MQDSLRDLLVDATINPKMKGARALVAAPMRLLRAADSLETALNDKLKGKSQELVGRYVGGESMRKALFTTALMAASKYSVDIGGEPSSLGMLQQAWSRSRKELIRDGNELDYLLTKIVKIEDTSVTEQTWRDVSETWQSFLALRTQMSTQMSQTVIDCILADRTVAEALGMADALKGIVGNPPTELITRLNQGPGVHIRAHAYQYDRKIKAELARIERIRETQVYIVNLLSLALTSIFVGIANFVSNYAYGMMGATSAATSG